MKKFIFLIINLIFFIFILEFISYNFIFGDFYKGFHFLRGEIGLVDEFGRKFYFRPIMMTYNDKKDYEKIKYAVSTRDDETLDFDSNKKAILFLGCSYTYGLGIKINKTFSSLVQKYTKRKSYNTGVFGNGISENCLKLKNIDSTNFFKDKQKIGYVIYTYMYHHIYRIHEFDICLLLMERYKANKNKSLLNKIKYYLSKSYFVKLLLCRRYISNKKNYWEIQCYMMVKLYQLSKKIFPEARFIFLLYDNTSNSNLEPFEKEFLDKQKWINTDILKKCPDMEIISTKDIVGDILWEDKYKLIFDPFLDPKHPNDKAWEIFVPKFAEKTNLK